MQQHWFYDVWAFIGAGGAIVMVAILLTTDTFRSNTTVSRWRDAMWLAWLAAPLYWVHQLEEYSLPVMGLPYSLPDMKEKKAAPQHRLSQEIYAATGWFRRAFSEASAVGSRSAPSAEGRT